MSKQTTHPTTGPAALTDEQRDGVACLTCGADLTTGRASVPVGILDGAQVFACTTHDEHQDDEAGR